MPAAPIVFLGDSITWGWGEWRADLFRQRNFLCAGIGGETSRQVKLRLSQVLNNAGACGLHLLCGINDIAENEGPVSDEVICANIAAMASEARDRGLQVWLGSIMPAEAIAWRPHIDPRPRIAALNRWLREHAEQRAFGFLDYHAVLATEDGALRAAYSYDGLHLSEQGYLAIEPLMLAALEPGQVV